MQDKRNRKESGEWLSTLGTAASSQWMIVDTRRKVSASHLCVSANSAGGRLSVVLAATDSACGFDTFVSDDRTRTATVDTSCGLTANKTQKSSIYELIARRGESRNNKLKYLY